MGIVYFYRESEKPFGCFSNFSPHNFSLDGQSWYTVEHYFQAQKFPGHRQADRIRESRSPMEAKRLGGDRNLPLRADWNSVKDDIMRKAVRAKFGAHDNIRAVLLRTGDNRLVENARNDPYWGIGEDGTGKNMLGRILMEIHAELVR